MAFDVPVTHRKPPERIERRLAPKRHAFYDDPAAKARARHEMAKAQREWIMEDRRQRLEHAAAYRDYVRAKKHAYGAPLPNSNSAMFSASDKKEQREKSVRPVAKRVAPRRIDKDIVRAEVREKAARAARRNAAAKASRMALERALRKARFDAEERGMIERKRRAVVSASGAAQRAAKRRA